MAAESNERGRRSDASEKNERDCGENSTKEDCESRRETRIHRLCGQTIKLTGARPPALGRTKPRTRASG